jgi:hypothetical protein
MTPASPLRRESFGYLSSPVRSHSFDEEPSYEPYTPQAVKTSRRNSDTFVAATMLGTALAMLLLTTIPVVAKIPDPSVWFSGDSLWRLFDPIITVPLNLSIVMQAEVFHTGGKHRFCECPLDYVYWNELTTDELMKLEHGASDLSL